MKLKGISDAGMNRIADVGHKHATPDNEGLDIPENVQTAFTVIGTDRQVGAIGAMQTFEEEVDAQSPEEAIELVREDRYNSNREHVFIKFVVYTESGEICWGPGTQST